MHNMKKEDLNSPLVSWGLPVASHYLIDQFDDLSI